MNDDRMMEMLTAFADGMSAVYYEWYCNTPNSGNPYTDPLLNRAWALGRARAEELHEHARSN
jgi:hypothetical protein